MREIKFRAFCKRDGLYFFYNLEISKHILGIESKLIIPDEIEQLSDWEQFTGLHDKNGKEIYEGDIVKRYDHDKGMDIIWHEELSCFEFREITSFIFNFAMARIDYEVIGNIHENPEVANEP